MQADEPNRRGQRDRARASSCGQDGRGRRRKSWALGPQALEQVGDGGVELAESFSGDSFAEQRARRSMSTGRGFSSMFCAVGVLDQDEGVPPSSRRSGACRRCR